jgi:hypothetical protein
MVTETEEQGRFIAFKYFIPAGLNINGMSGRKSGDQKQQDQQQDA